MPLLNNSVVISLYSPSSSLFDFSIRAILDFKGTPIVKTKCWFVFLAIMLNRIFVLLEILPQYLEADIIRGVYRTLSTITEFFAKIKRDF